jgi:hypothetical protein
MVSCILCENELGFLAFSATSGTWGKGYGTLSNLTLTPAKLGFTSCLITTNIVEEPDTHGAGPLTDSRTHHAHLRFQAQRLLSKANFPGKLGVQSCIWTQSIIYTNGGLSIHRMPGTRLGLPFGILLVALCTASASNVLVVITPGPASHMYGMRVIAQELATRQHNVLVTMRLTSSSTFDSL